MHFKTLSLVSALLISSTTFAAHEKLNSYDAIKNKLLSGETIKAIVDFEHDCKTQSNPGPNDSPNTLGFIFDEFVINYRTKEIIAGMNFLNANNDSNPFGQAGYSIGEIAVLPNNTVIVETYAVGVPDYKTMQTTKDICTISTDKSAHGVKFFVA